MYLRQSDAELKHHSHDYYEYMNCVLKISHRLIQSEKEFFIQANYDYVLLFFRHSCQAGLGTVFSHHQK